MSPIRGVDLGLLIGVIPSISMSLASLALSNIDVSSTIEACFQNFAAGLILAAVASELFPLMLEHVPEEATWIGVTVGFFIGFSLVFGLEPFIEWCGFGNEEEDEKGSTNDVDKEKEGSMKQIMAKVAEINKDSDSPNLVDYEVVAKKVSDDEGGEYHEAPIEVAVTSMRLPEHRKNLNEHIVVLVESINTMEKKCEELMTPGLSLKESEDLSEVIDEATHILQYKIDHCRRLLQGSESGNGEQLFTEERKVGMRGKLQVLKVTAQHLLEHLEEPQLTATKMKEMNEHIEDMDVIITSFHETVEKSTQRWTRRKRPMPEPSEGDKLPMGLVIPIFLDCFCDGFLIGVSAALSPKAAIVLGFANCLEMGFLGMAYAARIKKCTGTSFLTRTLALYGPPLVMFLAAGFGALVADQSLETPPVFVGFVAFGTVALISLVVGELVVEARQTMGGDDVWYVSLWIYAGVYLVLMLDRVI